MIGITTIFIFISFGLGLYNYVDEMFQGSSAEKLLSAKELVLPGSDLSFKLYNSDLKAMKSLGSCNATGPIIERWISKRRKYIYFLVTMIQRFHRLRLDKHRILNGRGLRGKDKETRF
jgi:hypothetical protein